MTIFIIVIDNDGSYWPAKPTTRRRGYEVGEYEIYAYNINPHWTEPDKWGRRFSLIKTRGTEKSVEQPGHFLSVAS